MGRGRTVSGFTLIEILLTCVVLSLGTLLLHQSYLRLADLYGRYINGMRIEGWTRDRLWESRQEWVYGLSEEPSPDSGVQQIGSKEFQWNRQIRPQTAAGLHSIRVNVAWLEGNRPSSISREIYVFRNEP